MKKNEINLFILALIFSIGIASSSYSLNDDEGEKIVIKTTELNLYNNLPEYLVSKKSNEDFIKKDFELFKGNCLSTASSINASLEQITNDQTNGTQFTEEVKRLYNAFKGKIKNQPFNKIEVIVDLKAFSVNPIDLFDGNSIKGNCNYKIRVINDKLIANGNGSITNVAQIELSLSDIRNLNSQNSVLSAIFRIPTSKNNPAPVEDRNPSNRIQSQGLGAR